MIKKNCVAYKQLEAMYKVTKGDKKVMPNPDWFKWQMDESELFTAVNIEESKKFARSSVAKLKQCYYNCWRLLTHDRALRYFEGFVTSDSLAFPLEHSWLVNKKNEVIDPTLILDINMKRKMVFDEKRVGDYYLGIEIPKDFALKMGMKLELSGPYLVQYYMRNKPRKHSKQLDKKILYFYMRKIFTIVPYDIPVCCQIFYHSWLNFKKEIPEYAEKMNRLSKNGGIIYCPDCITKKLEDK